MIGDNGFFGLIRHFSAKNFQRDVAELLSVSRHPDGGEAALTEFMHDVVSTMFEGVADHSWVIAARHILVQFLNTLHFRSIDIQKWFVERFAVEIQITLFHVVLFVVRGFRFLT